MQEVAFEEYRLRRQSGEEVAPEEYHTQFNVDVSAWPLLPASRISAGSKTIVTSGLGKRRPPIADVPEPLWDPKFHRTSDESASDAADPADSDRFREIEIDRPDSARRVKEALSKMPGVGAKFLGFRLVEELGRGAFGRVFLAQQTDLANRLVALKIATDIFEESQTLAQLQHTNIVPIYSFHQIGKLQAVCMPYFGSTTLGHVLQHLENLAGRPTSGKDLVSTLNSRKSMTRGEEESRHSSVTSAASTPAAPPAESPLSAPQSQIRRASEAWKILEGMSFNDAALWLSVRIVDGLAHAHEHGVLHRDLKPANILLTDDGTPMLLDFNLAINSELRADPAAARIGGTLPYMAPEQIRAFRGSRVAPDERSDIWSVGVIMFNLLTGRHPYHSYSGAINEIVEHMLEDRIRPAPSLRKYNADISPSLEAIVRRCLNPILSERYQSARDLHEDLERQLTNRPLKHTREPSRRERFAKWRRRHPRLASTGVMAALGIGSLFAAGGVALATRERIRTLHARAEFAAHRDEFQSIQAILFERSPTTAQLDEGLQRGRDELNRYGATAGLASETERKPDMRYLEETQRQRLHDDIGELFFLMAKAAAQKAERATDPGERDTELCSAQRWNELAQTSGDRLPRAIREQRADVFKLKGMIGEERSLREELRSMPPKSPRDHYLLGQWLVKEGHYRDALPHLIQATQDDPESFSAWMVRGNAHVALDQSDFAVASFSAAIALRPDFAPAWFNRGRAYSKLHFHELALEDLNRAIALDADLSEAYIQRASTRQALGQWDESVADLCRALECSHCSTLVWFLRSFAREQTGDWLGSATDWARGLNEQPNDELSFVARAENRLDHPEAALADVESALRMNSISADGLQLKAHILSERLHKPEESLAVLDRIVELYPDSATARAGRGVVLARQGKRTAAVRDAEESLSRDTKAPIMYMVACIYALTSQEDSGDRLQAFELLSSALRRGYGLDIVDEDKDLDPIRKLPEFTRIVDAAKELAVSRRMEPTASR
jgi:eukaryotic-like serine/threonine-protein kinase